MLELLTGPFDILDLDGNPQALYNGTQTEAFRWDDDLGLMYSEGWATEKIWIIQMDGAATERSCWFARYIMDIRDEAMNTYLVTNPPFESKLYDYVKRSGTYTEEILSKSGVTPLKDIQVRCDDRFIGISPAGSQVRAYPENLTGTSDYEVEANLTGTSSATLQKPVWSRTRDMDVLAIAYADGKIIFYDHIQKQQAPGAAFIGNNLGAWYSVRHNIWIKVTTGRQIEIYAATPRPHAITDPEPTGTPAQGKLTVFTVRLTGDLGESCMNEIIDWSLSEGSVGHLQSAQSTTDSDGYASIHYVAPIDSASSEVTIIAEFRH